jgi:hypothetical protein
MATGLFGFEANLLLFQRKIGLECYAIRFHEPAPPIASPDRSGEQFKEISTASLACIYHFGIGEGRFYKAAENWLRADSMRALVFMDDDLNGWRRFLECDLAAKILRDPQVHLRILAQDGSWSTQLARIATYFSQLPAAIIALPEYERERSSQWHALFNQLSELHFSRSLVASQQLNLNRTVYRNFYANLSQMSGAVEARRLENRFCKIPAVICGAGPSLQRAIPKLRRLADRALIMGGGSALTALTQAGIQPHFGAGLCPEATEAHRLWHQQGYEVPFLFRSRIDANALSYVHGPRLYLNGCAGAWKTAHWFEEQLGLKGEGVDEGPSVTYLATQFLLLLGCDPIIYVGVDLALEDEKSYAPGVLHGSEAPLIDWDRVQSRDIHGDPIVTHWKWIWESHVIGALIEEAKGTTTFINASDSGIGLPGALNMTFDQATERYLQRQSDLRGYLHSEIERGRAQISEEMIVDALRRFSQSLASVIDCINLLLVELRRVEVIVIQLTFSFAIRPDQPPPWIANGRAALLVREIEEEVAYQTALEPMWSGRCLYLARVYDQFGDRQGPIGARWKRELSIEQARWTYLLQCAQEQQEMILIRQNDMEGN